MDLRTAGSNIEKPHFLISSYLLQKLASYLKLKAQDRRQRGTIRPSKTSRSLLNVGDHLPVTTKIRRR
ncbi:hypothetical protein TNCT_655771 [Trichonephila clavata]|uniref:Uncharacterized protein n=1 Tax=Trichonephila clavata TaxID=2740835 RepID=A0A8X6KEU9_TRICU|nr:hypothetical protein TNCT_655771 [Trichonephila clavata]